MAIGIFNVEVFICAVTV
jgi:hypothetical protein